MLGPPDVFGNDFANISIEPKGAIGEAVLRRIKTSTGAIGGKPLLRPYGQTVNGIN